ncbi:hypothetical protein [Sphingomonas sp. UYP23]
MTMPEQSLTTLHLKRQEGVLWVSIDVPPVNLMTAFTETNFLSHVRDDKLRAQMQEAAGKFAMDPQSVAKAIAYVIEQPEQVNIGEIVSRSLNQP